MKKSEKTTFEVFTKKAEVSYYIWYTYFNSINIPTTFSYLRKRGVK
jgi:hypothetical protein